MIDDFELRLVWVSVELNFDWVEFLFRKIEVEFWLICEFSFSSSLLRSLCVSTSGVELFSVDNGSPT